MTAPTGEGAGQRIALHLPLDELRQRTSVRWTMHEPDVLPSFVAEMDYRLAEPISAALAEAVSRGDTGYAMPTPLPEVFSAWAGRTWGWHPDPDATIVVADVITGIVVALRWLTAPADPVVVMPPVYHPFFPAVSSLAGRPMVEVPLIDPGDGRLVPDLEGLAAAFRGGARTLLLCHPHNPTGVVLDRDELAALAAVCAEHDVLVISDEIHAPLAMPGVEHVPWPMVGPAASRSLVLTSASKAWNVPGLKCAVVSASSPDLGRALRRDVPLEARFGTGLLGVVAAEAAFTRGGPWLAAAVADIDRRRRELADLLAEHLPGARYRPPDAGYLAWVDLRPLGATGDPAPRLLQRGRVAVSGGPVFGQGGDGFIRLTLATSPEILADVVARVARGVA